MAREIEGIGFKTADRIAINLGFANDAPPRLDAGILFAMETLQEEGHTAFGEEALRDHASEMLDDIRGPRHRADRGARCREAARAALPPARPRSPSPARASSSCP